MDIFQIVFLALIQGLTEFLPISSSAHLILPAHLLGWKDQGLAFDVAVHVGSLMAVMLYFRQDIQQLLLAWGRSLATLEQTQDSRVAWYVVWATIPAGLFGLFFDDFIEANLRSTLVIAISTIVFGLVLLWSDKSGSRSKTLLQMSLKMALIIGLAQAIALIPGTSRSGITISAALLLGMTRDDAARFSFLLSIPLIAMGGGYKALGLIGSESVIWIDMLIGIAVSALSAFVCIHYFLKFINSIGMLPFVIYRLLLGALLLLLVFL